MCRRCTEARLCRCSQGAARWGRGASRRWSAARRCWGSTGRTCAAASPRASCSPRQGAPKERSSSESCAPAGRDAPLSPFLRPRGGGEGRTGRGRRASSGICPGVLTGALAASEGGGREPRNRPSFSPICQPPRRAPAHRDLVCPLERGLSAPLPAGKTGSDSPLTSINRVAVSTRAAVHVAYLVVYTSTKIQTPWYCKNQSAADLYP